MIGTSSRRRSSRSGLTARAKVAKPRASNRRPSRSAIRRHLGRVAEGLIPAEQAIVASQQRLDLGLPSPQRVGAGRVEGEGRQPIEGVPVAGVRLDDAFQEPASVASSSRDRDSQAVSRGTCAGSQGSGGRCFMASATSATRPVAWAQSSRRQTETSTGRRRRQSSSRRPASSNCPVRRSRFARPSQTRSSSGAIRPACSSPSRTTATGCGERCSSMCSRTSAMACSEAPSSRSSRRSQRTSIDSSASRNPALKPVDRAEIEVQRRAVEPGILHRALDQRLGVGEPAAVDPPLHPTLDRLESNGESTGTEAHASSASSSRPLACSQRPSR